MLNIDKSLLSKGIVICMMVWLHLFNGNLICIYA